VSEGCHGKANGKKKAMGKERRKINDLWKLIAFV
jgi:hypothetical protein